MTAIKQKKILYVVLSVILCIYIGRILYVQYTIRAPKENVYQVDQMVTVKDTTTKVIAEPKFSNEPLKSRPKGWVTVQLSVDTTIKRVERFKIYVNGIQNGPNISSIKPISEGKYNLSFNVPKNALKKKNDAYLMVPRIKKSGMNVIKLSV